MNLPEVIENQHNLINDPSDFTELDGIIFSEMAALLERCRMAGIDVNTYKNGTLTVAEAIDLLHLADGYDPNHYDESKSEDRQKRIFHAIKTSERYKDLILSDAEQYDDIHYYSDGKGNSYYSEFKASVITIPNCNVKVIGFAGTGTLIESWIEDGRMGYTDAGIGSQIEATEYMQKVMQKYPDNDFYITGYSKGANLGIYAACYVDYDMNDRRKGKTTLKFDGENKLSDRIKGAYLYDGPGFNENAFKDPVFKENYEKFMSAENTYFFAPANDFVAQLLIETKYIDKFFDTNNTYTPQEGNALLNAFQFFGNFVMSHDNQYWEFNPDGSLVMAEGNTNTDFSKTVNIIIDNVVSHLSDREFMRLCDLLEMMCEYVGISTVQDLGNLSEYQQERLITFLSELDESDYDLLGSVCDAFLSGDNLATIFYQVASKKTENGDYKDLILPLSMVTGSGILAVLGLETFRAFKGDFDKLFENLLKGKRIINKMTDPFFESPLEDAYSEFLKALTFIIRSLKIDLPKFGNGVYEIFINVKDSIVFNLKKYLPQIFNTKHEVNAKHVQKIEGSVYQVNNPDVRADLYSLKTDADTLRSLKSEADRLNNELIDFSYLMLRTHVKDSQGQVMDTTYSETNNIRAKDLKINEIDVLTSLAQSIEKKVMDLIKLESKMTNYQGPSLT